MELNSDPFRYDRLKLSFKDLIKLLFGQEIKKGALIIRGYKMPEMPE